MASKHEASSKPPRFIAYCRGSTYGQAFSLEQQREALEDEAFRRHYQLVEIVEEQASARAKSRPQLDRCMRELEKGRVDGLMVTRLDRLARSVRDASDFFESSKKYGWTLIMLDPQVDTSTPYGLAFASVAAVFAELESNLVSQRTKEALAVKKAQGVKLGRQDRIPPHIEERIMQDHKFGLAPVRIAEGLEADGIPTQRGGRWGSKTVQGVIDRCTPKPLIG